MELNKQELDRHITGNWGEDQFGPEEYDPIPAIARLERDIWELKLVVWLLTIIAVLLSIGMALGMFL